MMTPSKPATRRGGWLAAAVLGLAGLATTAPAAPPGEIPFGVYDPPGDFQTDADVQIEHLFLPWEDVFLPSLLDADRYALERNRAILLTIEPWTWNRSERNMPQILHARLRSGDYDHYMRDICEVLDKMDSPITVRFAQEMDDYSSQFIWAGWEPENYIFAYRRMIDICREEAPRINVMWSPLGYANMADYYPGDEYVDLIGLSVFGFQQWEEDVLGRSLTFEDILGPRYDRAAQFGKPIVVPELGYSGNADYVEQWENTIRQRNPRFPDLVGVVYFNQREVYPWPDNHGLPDWRIQDRVLSN
jgi:endoglucanase